MSDSWLMSDAFRRLVKIKQAKGAIQEIEVCCLDPSTSPYFLIFSFPYTILNSTGLVYLKKDRSLAIFEVC